MDFLIDGPEESRRTFVFAHGAGGAMDGPFMTRVALGIAAAEIRVVRFEFPYMSARRRGERRGMPDRQPVLLDCWRDVVRALGGGERLVIGGKSLGGRMASIVADELSVAGLLCLGYPFHPPGQPTKLRTAHLETLKTPALIVQGTRDPFGTWEDVAAYALSPAIQVEWITGGDHSFKPRERENLETVVSAGVRFITSV
jgi:predicted alpha/beta-hydrolase family hydrolase